MKRGFLNTRKAKQRVAEAVDAESTQAQAGGPPHKESKDNDEKGERYVIIIVIIAHCKTILL